jgi:hypothetical protein
MKHSECGTGTVAEARLIVAEVRRLRKAIDLQYPKRLNAEKNAHIAALRSGAEFLFSRVVDGDRVFASDMAPLRAAMDASAWDAAKSGIAELEALRADKARLDWLATIATITPGDCDRCSESYYVIRIPTGHDYYRGGEHLALLSAIDAAKGAA